MDTEIVSATPSPSMSVVLKGDSSGFASQECPACRRRFKAQRERFASDNVKGIAHCPYCEHDGLQCWWTPEQASYIKADVARKLFANSKYIKAPAEPSQPPAELEDDLPNMIAFTCCNERIRHDGASTELRCIVCGAKTSAT